MSVPLWTTDGLLPRIRTGLDGADPDRSPYETNSLDLVTQFAVTTERVQVLDGWLRYREALYQLGITHGWQWIDGSFMEEVEVLEGRPPNDVDVVTFFDVPAGMTQEDLFSANRDFFTSEKQVFQVDAYYLQMGVPTDRPQVRQIAYWYSMWSHRRTGAWKGFVQVDLDPALDVAARANLAAVGAEEGAA